MDIFSAFATDEQREIQGAWFDVPGGDARILVARSNNPIYTKAVVKAYEKYAKAPKNSTTEKQQEADYIRVMAQHLLLDWESVQYQGAALDYTKENAEMLLKIKDFRVFVQQCSDDFESFKVETEQEVGNS
jgi:hypothetical protein